MVEKEILINRRAQKEIDKLPKMIRVQITAIFESLSREGRLKEPLAKVIGGNLFEARVSRNGQWRVIYSYVGLNSVIILSSFNKKTQKTPSREIHKARARLLRHVN